MHYVNYFELVVSLGTMIFAISIWVWKHWKNRQHPHWQTTEGTVEAVRAYQADGRIAWCIVYSYCANGEYFSGEFSPRVPWTTKKFSSHDKMEDLLRASYRTGIKFPLRFNPDEPEWSVPCSREPMANAQISQTGD